MRSWGFAGCGLIFVLGALLASGDGDVKIRLRLIDADSKTPMTGIVRIVSADSGKAVALPGLLDRLRGLKLPDDVSGWHVVPQGGGAIVLPRGVYRLEALAGLETAVARQELDLRKAAPAEVAVKLDFLFRPEKHGLVAGNTHLHLMKLTAEQSDDYLRQIPAADLLRVMFISYLERKPDDKEYITNRYKIGDLPEFNATGVLFNNGEEHRHNFKGYGQGYGHVMFLNIKKLVEPVSIGPGIMLTGNDDTPLAPGIENARRQGGTVIWCHNTNGYEDVLNALAGRLDALNVFDGSRTGLFEDNYYRYLNVGLRLPISTGTDWFMYDFSRVYARVPETGKVESKLTLGRWLEAVKAGQCQATNSPLLSLRVDDQEIGGTLKLGAPRVVKIEASAVGRHDFQTLELVHNGKVIKSVRPDSKQSPYRATLKHEVRVEEPGWFAARISSKAKNEFDRQLFGHTSPVYVEMAGRNRFDVDDALDLLKQIEEGAEAIRAQGFFSSPDAKSRMVASYDKAAASLRERINKERSTKGSSAK